MRHFLAASFFCEENATGAEGLARLRPVFPRGEQASSRLKKPGDLQWGLIFRCTNDHEENEQHQHNRKIVKIAVKQAHE